MDANRFMLEKLNGELSYSQINFNTIEVSNYYNNLLSLQEYVGKQIELLDDYFRLSLQILLNPECKRMPLVKIAKPVSRVKSYLSNTLPVSYIPITAVKDGLVHQLELTTIYESGNKCKLAKTGDIIICRIKDSLEIGRYAVIEATHNGHALVSSDFLILEPISSVHPRWITSVLSQESVLNNICSNSYGAAIQRINNEYLLNTMVPFPTLEEQVALLNKISIKKQKYNSKITQLDFISQKISYIINNYVNILIALAPQDMNVWHNLVPFQEIEQIIIALLDL